jgi:hypothetical protein
LDFKLQCFLQLKRMRLKQHKDVANCIFTFLLSLFFLVLQDLGHHQI